MSHYKAEPDYISVAIGNTSLYANDTLSFLKPGYSVTEVLPKQYTSIADKVFIDSVKAVARTFILFNIILVVIGQFLFSRIVKLIWPLYNCLQLITYMALTNMEFPKNVEDILKQIKGAMAVDAIPIDSILKRFLASSTVKLAKSNAFILSLIAVPFFSLLTFFIWSLIRCLKNLKSPCCNKILDKIDRIFLFKMIIRMSITMYLQICTIAIKFTFELVILSTTCKVVVIIICALSFAFARYADPKYLETPNVRKRIGSLYLGVKTDKKERLALQGVFFARRILFVLILTIPQIFSIKLGFLLILISLQLTYYWEVRPYTELSMHRLEVFNEMCIIVLLQFTPIFT